MRTGNTAEGIARLREYVQTQPADAQGHLYLGDALKQSGETNAAYPEIATALLLDPTLPDQYAKSGTEDADAGKGGYILEEASTGRAAPMPRLGSVWVLNVFLVPKLTSLFT